MRKAGALMALVAATTPAHAADGLDVSAVYTADTAATLAGGADRELRYLGNLDLVAVADLETLAGIDGITAQIYLLHNHGGRPNDGAGTLEGVDNIEVPSSRGHLYEAWLEKRFAGGSLRAGLYDLNSEFYATASSDLLIAPPFGIGTELAATGSNGPSIFPSTGLAVRARVEFPGSGYLQMAAINAKAQTFGDPGGVDLGFDEGLLLIGEAGTGERLRLAIGGWRYTRAIDDLIETDAGGQPLRRHARGAYVLAEARVVDTESRRLTAFFRGGISDGQTGPFRASFQTGMLLEPAFTARPDSAFSIGLRHVSLSGRQRALLTAEGERPARGEDGLEITYSDRVSPFLMVQPDLQWVRRPGGLDDAADAVVALLRLTFEF